MQIDFVKMHGLGNDFMIFDAPRVRFPMLKPSASWRADTPASVLTGP